MKVCAIVQDVRRLKTCLDFVRAEGILASVPTFRPPAARAVRTTMALEPADFPPLLDALHRTPDAQLYVHALRWTKQRPKVLLNLRWSDVNLAEKKIVFCRNGQAGAPKTSVPIPAQFMSALHAAFERRTSEYVIAYRSKRESDMWHVIARGLYAAAATVRAAADFELDDGRRRALCDSADRLENAGVDAIRCTVDVVADPRAVPRAANNLRRRPVCKRRT